MAPAASERTLDAIDWPLCTAEESLGPGAMTTGVAVAMLDRKLDALASMEEATSLTAELAWEAFDAIALVAADFTDARSKEILLSLLAAAGTMTGVTGVKVSWEVGMEMDGGRTIDVV